MKNNKICKIGMFCCCALLMYAGEANAADVLDTVRDKAAAFIRDLRPLIFILGGFGIIGFAFGAIFGKISWKWFANIAIGLFLVANVGLFIDYFATRHGRAGQYAEKLGYGHYLDESGDYTPTQGSSSGPESQKDPGTNGSNGQTENNNSENMSGGCVPGTGINCGESSGGGQTTGGSQTAGGSQTTGQNSQQNGLPEDLANAPEMTVDEIIQAMGKQGGAENVANAAQSGSTQNTNNAIENTEKSNEDVSQIEKAFEEGNAVDNAADVGNLYNQISQENNQETADLGYDIDGGSLDEVVKTGKDYSQEKQSCQLTGGTWNSETMSCDKDMSNIPGWNGISAP